MSKIEDKLEILKKKFGLNTLEDVKIFLERNLLDIGIFTSPISSETKKIS